MCVHGSQAVYCTTELCLSVDKLKKKKQQQGRNNVSVLRSMSMYILSTAKTENTYTHSSVFRWCSSKFQKEIENKAKIPINLLLGPKLSRKMFQEKKNIKIEKLKHIDLFSNKKKFLNNFYLIGKLRHQRHVQFHTNKRTPTHSHQYPPKHKHTLKPTHHGQVATVEIFKIYIQVHLFS